MRSWRISTRLVGTLVVLIGGLWLAGVAVAAIWVLHEIGEVFDSALQETAQRLMPLTQYHLEERAEPWEVQLPEPYPAQPHTEVLFYQVRNAQGEVILRSHDAPAEPFPVPLKQGFFDHEDHRYFTEVSKDKNVFVQVVETPEDRQEAIEAVWFGLITPLVGLLPIAGFVTYWTVKRATRPIGEVQRQIAMRSGENLEPIDARGLPGELVPIIQDINRLLERLQAALEAEHAFAANSAHELRNPIAAARAQAELIAEGLRGNHDHARATQLIEMLGRLGRRIEKMLQLARAEAGLGLARTETDLVAITRMVVVDYARKPKLAERLVFHPGSSQTLIVSIDPDALGIALQNLIDNALAHGASETPVEITIGPGATVHVVNDGPVVGADELATLTQRFERAGSKRAPGAGLGLSIVEHIMRQAGGRLELASPPEGKESGFAATLVFPGQGEKEKR